MFFKERLEGADIDVRPATGRKGHGDQDALPGEIDFLRGNLSCRQHCDTRERGQRNDFLQ